MQHVVERFPDTIAATLQCRVAAVVLVLFIPAMRPDDFNKVVQPEKLEARYALFEFSGIHVKRMTYTAVLNVAVDEQQGTESTISVSKISALAVTCPVPHAVGVRQL